MIILSIETSCDDTGVALLEEKNGKITILSDALSSQDEIHKKWGGVYPTEAKREHQKNLLPALVGVLEKASFLEKGSVKKPEEIEEILSREKDLLKDLESFFSKNKIKNSSSKKIDAIAVTVGPGLDPCLWVGVNFARALSLYIKKPIIPVNHIQAHILFFLKEEKKIKFPALALIVSGGHTELILMKSIDSYEIIGKTRDDAAGECFDKAARILGLGYPGGPEISKKASDFLPSDKKFSITLPRPMMYSKNYDFSFSGLKTAILYDFMSRTKKIQKNSAYIKEMAYETENAITDVLISKLKKAIEEYNAKTVIMGGGVTANKRLQEKFNKLKEDFPSVKYILPPLSFSTDNAKIIGIAAFLKKEKRKQEEVTAIPNLRFSDKL